MTRKDKEIKDLVGTFDKVLTRVAKRVKRNKNKDAILTRKVGESIRISDFCVEKDGELYSITRNGKNIHTGLCTMDLAASMVHNIINRKPGSVSSLKSLSDELLKLENELSFYYNSLKNKKKEDKFISYARIDEVELRLEGVKDQISTYRISI